MRKKARKKSILHRKSICFGKSYQNRLRPASNSRSKRAKIMYCPWFLLLFGASAPPGGKWPVAIPISLESGIVFEPGGAKRFRAALILGHLPSRNESIVRNLGHLPSGGDRRRRRRRLTWISPSPHPITPRKKIRRKARVLT